MFNNNNNNGNNSQNIWDQMALFNQLMLCNILNGWNDSRTPKLRTNVAPLKEEQKDDALVLLECNTEELAGLPDGQGMQAVANFCIFLDYLLTPSDAIAQASQTSHREEGYIQEYIVEFKELKKYFG